MDDEVEPFNAWKYCAGPMFQTMLNIKKVNTVVGIYKILYQEFGILSIVLERFKIINTELKVTVIGLWKISNLIIK